MLGLFALVVTAPLKAVVAYEDDVGYSVTSNVFVSDEIYDQFRAAVPEVTNDLIIPMIEENTIIINDTRYFRMDSRHSQYRCDITNEKSLPARTPSVIMKTHY